MDNQGRLQGLKPLSPTAELAVKSALNGGRAETPAIISALNEKTASLMGSPNGEPSFALLSPAGTVVADPHPIFRWRTLKGATGYRVTIFDADFNEAAASETVTGTEWRTREELQRGMIYSWQVTAILDGKEVVSPTPPLRKPRFTILEQSQAEASERERKQVEGSHLALGVLYARVGLLDEAEREFQMLLAANPRSPVARHLLRNLRALRRGG